MEENYCITWNNTYIIIIIENVCLQGIGDEWATSLTRPSFTHHWYYQESMASYCGPLSSRVIKSIQGGMGGWRSKCKNCQLADQFPTSPSGGPSTATAHKSTIRVSKERQGRGSFQHYYKKNKFGGFA